MYFVCYQLSRRGWNAMPTARNARGVDVIAYDRGATCMIALQIKALSKRDPVPLGSSIDGLMGDLWIIVNRALTDPSCWIMTPAEVRALAHHGRKDGKSSFWLQPEAYERADFKEAWHRLDAIRKT